MRAWIISAGSFERSGFYRSLVIKEDDMVICADGGYDYAVAMGITPTVVLGDLDSIRKPIKDSRIPVIKFPTDKDKTDSHLAVDYALENKCDEIILLAATGGRIDHSLANIMLLGYIRDHGAEGLILTEKSRIALITGQTTIKRGMGDNISFVPITPFVEGVTTEGLLYNLNNKTVKQGDTLTISNEFRSHEAKVKLTRGRLLVICDA